MYRVIDFYNNINKILFLLAACFVVWSIFDPSGAAAKKDEKKTILFVPQDDRPISSTQTADVIRALGYTVEMPPKDLLGDRDRTGRPEELSRWVMENGGKDKVAVLSSDALVYGSLVASRKHHLPKNMLVARLNNINKIHKEHPDMPLYVFTSVMRTPKDGAASGTEEPDYYIKYGQLISSYTKIDNADTSGLNESYQVALREEIPEADLQDWMNRRKTNVAVSTQLINMVKDGTINYLALGKDDNEKYSQTERESQQLDAYAMRLGLGSDRFQSLTGLDEVGLIVMTRVVNQLDKYSPYVYVKYAPGFGGATVPSYSDEPIDNTISSQITAAGGQRTYDARKADLIMMINTNRSGWTYDANTPINTLQPRYNTLSFVDDVQSFIDAGRHVAIGDITFANGSDNALMNELQSRGLLEKLYGYAGWNTPTNSTGFALAMGLVNNRTGARQREDLLLTRYLDDWVYQANIRQNVNSYINILPGKGNYLTIGDDKLTYAEQYGTKMMRSFIGDKLDLFGQVSRVSISMPWDRIFEADINLYTDPDSETVLKKHLRRAE